MDTNERSSDASLELKKEVRGKDIGLGIINIEIIVLEQIGQNLGKSYIVGAGGGGAFQGRKSVREVEREPK